MLQIFDFDSYRGYLAKWIDAQGDRAYGLKGSIARALGISSSLVSQILKGEKNLTPDQTADLVDFMGLTDLEGDYLHLLTEFERAAKSKYREKLRRKITTLREQSRAVGKRVPRSRELSDEERAQYYSSWLFTAVRNLSALPSLPDAVGIADHLRVDAVVVQRVLRFLLDRGLCIQSEAGLTYGPASTHIDNDSPFVNKHHQNWRLRAIDAMESRRESDMFFTSPMSLSREANDEIRRRLPAVIQEIMKISGPSPSETVACLNIDWFKF